MRNRSQVRVLDRPLAGIQKFAAFARCSGFRAESESEMVGVLRGAIWGHRLVACDEKRSWVRAAVKVGAGSENAVGAS